MSGLIHRIASDAVIDEAYKWLCKHRVNLSHNNDVWEFRRNWQQLKPEMQQTLLEGEYRFNPLVEIRFADGNLECWCAADSLVLKAMAIVLGKHLAPVISPACFHVVGHGGAKKAVRDAYHHLEPGSHVMKSDVKSYYTSFDNMLLFGSLHEYITDRHVLSLLWQYLKRTVCYGENYRDVSKGISLGCPLSPLMAAMFLKPLDDVMQGCGLFYVRFMDDWLVIAPTRWKLRKAVRMVNTVLERLLLEKHPDKTFIGRAERGFDFLGYHFSPDRLTVAVGTLRRFVDRIARLYEQGADYLRIGLYVKRWWQWVSCGCSDKRIAEMKKARAMMPLPLGELVLLLSASDADSSET